MLEQPIITDEIKNNIRKIISELKKVLKDDKDFAKEIVDFFTTTDNLYYNDLISIIYEKYANKDWEILEELKTLIHEIKELYLISGKLQEEVYNLSDEERDGWIEDFQEKVSEEINDVFTNSEDVKDVDIIGGYI